MPFASPPPLYAAVAAGGAEYIAALFESLTRDQGYGGKDIPDRLSEVDVVVVPVLIDELGDSAPSLGDCRALFTTDQLEDMARVEGVVAYVSLMMEPNQIAARLAPFDASSPQSTPLS